MNKERRQALADVEDTISEAIDQIQDVINEEQDALDNLPDSLLYSERGEKMQDAIDEMEGLIGELEEFCTNLGKVVDAFTPAKSTANKSIHTTIK